VKETRDGAYITKDGRNSPRKIDVAVAAVVAHERAVELAGGSGELIWDWRKSNPELFGLQDEVGAVR
jgi:hypothetical protein